MQVTDDLAVYFNYTLTNDDGDVLDTSDGGEPLSYLHGHGNIISGLEEAMEGKVKGAKFDVVIPPEKAYGVHDEALIQKVSKEVFKDAPELEVGLQFQANTPQGLHVFTITEIEGDEVTVDGNHELAGETLHFNIEITEVRKATKEETSHGHIHGAGCHHH